MAEKVRAVIICGSPEADIDFIKSFVRENDYVMCADNGYNTAKKAGIIPDIFVGDFDSYKGVVEKSVEVVRLNTHKDDTDTMHCAELAARYGFKKAALLAATGARLDHTLANFNVLKFFAEHEIEASVNTRTETVHFHTVGEYTYNKLNGRTFSLIPFCCESAVVSFEGNVEYPAQELELSSSQVTGVSNIFKSDSVKINILKGNVLVVVNLI